MVLTYGSTASGDSTSWAMATTTLTASSTVGGIGIQGWIIKYHTTTATSAPITSTTATSASITSTITQTSSTTAPATSQPISATSSSSGSALTPAAKMGIGVGVGVGAIGVIALLVALFLFHKRRQRTESESVHNLYHYPQPPITSVPQAEYYQPRYPAELNAFKLRPGEGGNPPAELPSRNWASGNGVS
ncbi:hypothetical protein F1880_001453 [Penicillium rolfsii]|nr:hypothetical protein F1880_001453 [Penicillium rolfsii]